LIHASWAPRGTEVVAGATPAVAKVEKMAPLYRMKAARTTAQISAVRENLVIGVPSRVFSCIRAAKLSLSRPRGEAAKLGTALCKKQPKAVDKCADNGWKTKPQVCGPPCA
jgi:hypothetical protein